MNIKEVDEGKKIDYSINGNKITFGDDELTINLEKYEKDTDVEINICTDADGLLLTTLAERYVAVIVIPARSYNDDVAVPFSMDNVNLYLFALKEG